MSPGHEMLQQKEVRVVFAERTVFIHFFIQLLMYPTKTY